MLKYLLPFLLILTNAATASESVNAVTFGEVQTRFCSNLNNSVKRTELNRAFKIADVFLIKTEKLFKHVPGTGEVSGLGYKYQTSSDSIDLYSAANLTGAIDKDSVVDTKLSADIDELGTFKHKLLEMHGQLRSEKYKIMNMPKKGVLLLSGIEYQLLNMAEPLGEMLVAKMEPDASEMDIAGARHLLTMTSYHRIVAGLACDLK